MNVDTVMQSLGSEVWDFLATPNAFRSVLILLISMTAAYWLSRFLAQAIIKIAQKVSDRSEKESNDQRVLRYQQIETYLSMTVAIVRVLVVIVVGYITWRFLSPFANESSAANSVAAIGAGTLFVVLAGRTIGIVLQDLTAGSVMIAEGWFHVGDYVKLEPFMDAAGIVERFTLRSTKIRALSGEIIWIHNQNITGVHVTPKSLRTIAVEVFVRDKTKGEKTLKRLIQAMPTGKMMLARPLKIVTSEKWGEDAWHFMVVGQTPPGREWLIQEYFLQSIERVDEDKSKKDRLLAHPPMAHAADAAADKKFRRSVRVRQDTDAG